MDLPGCEHQEIQDMGLLLGLSAARWVCAPEGMCAMCVRACVLVSMLQTGNWQFDWSFHTHTRAPYTRTLTLSYFPASHIFQ